MLLRGPNLFFAFLLAGVVLTERGGTGGIFCTDK
jgi:hypothetical protein